MKGDVSMIDPVAFRIFGLHFTWYGIIIALGMFLAVIMAAHQAKAEGLNDDIIYDLSLWVLPAALIGARLYYVIFQWEYYGANPREILAFREGGLAIHGGVFLAFIVGAIFLRFKKLKFWKFADIVAPSLILGQAIGRWGNFINQEAYGGPVTEEYISRFPRFIQNQMFINGQHYHPTFLYESLWNFVVLGLLILYRRKVKKIDGELIAMYAILYSLGRFVIEGLRTDSLMIGSVRTAQLVSLVLIFLGMAIIFFKRVLRTNE
jgi:phosphatidylglycerol---prolipoprotein diacylglyceryl transferase